MSRGTQWFIDVLQKYSVAIATAVLIGVTSFVVDYSKRFFSLPEKVQAIENKRIQDSTFAAGYVLQQEETNKVMFKHIFSLELKIDSIKKKRK